MTSRFAGKVVLIAGGTGGLGQAVSLAFLQEGAKVVVTYQKMEEFKRLENAAGERAAELQGHQVNVLDESAVRQLVEGIVGRQGHPDILVNAVGAYAGGLALWETEPSVFETMLDLNLRSGYILARTVVPEMLKQKRGVIVNVASKAAFDHAAGAFAYAVAKAAAVRMIDCLAEDPARHRRAGQLGNSQYYRHARKSSRHARRRLQPMAKAAGHRKGNPIFVQ
jgi:NAD(P)-dependent dehydrogenase (short-subunit alcohol dehydrogenase family)